MDYSEFPAHQITDVVVVGSCNIDLINYVPHLPVKGQTVHGSSFKTGFGGKGANQCVAARKLGAACTMISKVGRDAHGDGFVNEFNKFGVNTDYVTRCDEATGVASCFVDEDGDSSIVIVSGANMQLSPADVLEAKDIISKAKILICQLETEEETTLAALKLAKEAGVITVFNPAPRKSDLNQEIFKYCDIFCPNETEISDVPVRTPEQAGLAALEYLEKGCSTVIVTLGRQGSVYVTKENREPIHLPCPQVKAIDTSGAGDSLIGALAFFMTHFAELPAKEKLARAMQVASTSVQRHGTQKSYPTRDELPQELFTIS